MGYELFIVEQWACSRVDPTFIITTFTGFASHGVTVDVLSVPKDENEWSPRLRVYLKAICKYHARKKDTPLGILMVTNLSGFPSALTVITVPDGDVKAYRESFVVNENLKRLGCSGRAGLSLLPPSGATRAKFNQLYRTSGLVPIDEAAVELVRLCQAALVLFTKLDPEYADGLLCDVTEQAITRWWTELGTDYYNAERNDGILGPTTVSGLLGMLLGARNRLNAYGSPVSKDVFNLKATKRGITYFQKWQKLHRTRHFDRQTLERLHKVTSKAANSEGWAVPKAVRSTVAELSGKGGEMVMGMVGARDRAGISEVETIDMNKFLTAISGERCKWLWYGKPMKHPSSDFLNSLVNEDDTVFSGDENPVFLKASKKPDLTTEVSQPRSGHNHMEHLYANPSGSQSSLDPADRDQALRRGVLRSVTERMHDARSGLGRFRDAVGISGLRGHHHRTSKEDSTLQARTLLLGSSPGTRQRSASPVITTPSYTSNDVEPPWAVAAGGNSTEYLLTANTSPGSGSTNIKLLSDHNIASPSLLEPGNYSIDTLVRRESMPSITDSHKNSTTEGAGLNEEMDTSTTSTNLFRYRGWSTQSLVKLSRESYQSIIYNLRPRNISFSAVEDVLLLTQFNSMDARSSKCNMNASGALRDESFSTLQAKHAVGYVLELTDLTRRSTTQGIKNVKEMESYLRRDHNEITKIHYQKHEEHNALRHATNNLLAEEQTSLGNALKEIEVQGAKLEYELDTLISKLEDVEDGVAEFRRQIVDLEERANALEDQKVDETPWYWKGVVFLVGLR